MLPPAFRSYSLLLAATLALAAILLTTPAQAGPTLGVDLDLGTSVDSLRAPEIGVDSPPALYDVGFRIRPGWRFDLGPFFIVPEAGVGYDVERAPLFGASISSDNSALVRVLAGARAGWSFPLLPALRLEPAIYGHVGYARLTSESGANGLANDVGLALDLRVLKFFTVGAHVGYDVATLWFPGPGCSAAIAFTTNCGSFVPPPTVGDGWLAYGIQAGVVFW